MRTPSTISLSPIRLTPVSVTSFTSSLGTGEVTLNWQTSNETNNAGFDVLRKGPGEAAYKLIASYMDDPGLVGLGAGTNSAVSSYSFTDSNVTKGATYSYQLQSVSIYGVTKLFNQLSVTGVEGGPAVPRSFALLQNYPNPFNPTTTITYDLPYASRVTISIYDVLGRRVETLVNESKSAGEYRASFNGGRYASGVYFYRMIAIGANGKNYSAIKKLVLLK